MKARATHQEGALELGVKWTMTDDYSPLTQLIAKTKRPILFFNIGYSPINGDVYGPMLGSMLRDMLGFEDSVAIMGTEDDCIGAIQLPRSIETAKRRYPKHLCIAVDSANGQTLGSTRLGEGMCVPGAGVNKQLPPVGDYYLQASTFHSTADAIEDMVQAMQGVDRDSVRTLVRRAAHAIVAGFELRRQQAAKARNRAAKKRGVAVESRR